MNAGAGKLTAKRIVHAVQGPFRGAVHDGPGERNLAADRSDVDDNAGAPRAHVRDGELGDCEGGKHVDVENALGHLGIDFGGVAVLADAGVVNKDVDAAEAFDGSFDGVVSGRGVSDVAGGDQMAGRFEILEAGLFERGE